MKDISGKVAIVGVDESDQIGVVPDKSALQLHAEAARNALRDAGLSARDVDGLFTAGVSTTEVGEYLGIEPTYTDGTNVGGSSFVLRLQGFRGDTPILTARHVIVTTSLVEHRAIAIPDDLRAGLEAYAERCR